MTVAFHRQHEILIGAPVEAVYDVIANPNFRRVWCEASSGIESAERPLKRGERFREKLRTRHGILDLNWVVLDDERPNSWTIRADTHVVGPIVLRYCLSQDGAETRCLLHVTNPRRPSEPSPDLLLRIDQDTREGLAGLKRLIEDRQGTQAA